MPVVKSGNTRRVVQISRRVDDTRETLSSWTSQASSAVAKFRQIKSIQKAVHFNLRDSDIRNIKDGEFFQVLSAKSCILAKRDDPSGYGH